MFKCEITPRLAVGAVLIAYLAAAMLVAIPFWLAGILSPADALFEGISTATLTGATVLSHPSQVPGWLVYWRSLILWIMGLGTILFFVVLLPKYLNSPYLLFADRENGYFNWQTFTDISQTLRLPVILYGGVTLALTGALWLSGLDFFHSLNYGVGVVTTAGFPLEDGPVLTGLNGWTRTLLTLGMFWSGGSYALYYMVWQKGWRLWQDEEWRTYVGLLLCATVAVALQMFYMGLSDYTMGEILFQTVSFASTTGYAVTNVYIWPAGCRLLLFLFLILGGCAGSTAGGLKVYRGLLLAKGFEYDIRRVFHPTIADGVEYNGSLVKNQTVTYVEFFFFLYVLSAVLVAFLLSWNDTGGIESIFTAFGALSNSGGIIGPAAHSGSYAGFSVTGKLGLMLGMFLGRLEMFLVLVLILPEFWKNEKW